MMLLEDLIVLPQGTPLIYARWVVEKGGPSIFSNRNHPDKFVPLIKATTFHSGVADLKNGDMVDLRTMQDGELIRVALRFVHVDRDYALRFLAASIQLKLHSVKTS
jgi:hypothetical protein